MPNHVSNRIEAPKHVFDEVLTVDENGNVEFDFNQIIPMPTYVYSGDLGEKEREQYGANNWYDWSVQHWGTKWNAYTVKRVSDTVLTFETAWSHPTPVMFEMSSLFPDDAILFAYADEDLGHNFGVYRLLGGEIIEESSVQDGSPVANRLASILTGFSYEENIQSDIRVVSSIIEKCDENDPDLESLKIELAEFSIELSNYEDEMKELERDYPGFDFENVESYLHL